MLRVTILTFAPETAARPAHACHGLSFPMLSLFSSGSLAMHSHPPGRAPPSSTTLFKKLTNLPYRSQTWPFEFSPAPDHRFGSTALQSAFPIIPPQPTTHVVLPSASLANNGARARAPPLARSPARTRTQTRAKRSLGLCRTSPTRRLVRSTTQHNTDGGLTTMSRGFHGSRRVPAILSVNLKRCWD